MDYNINNIVTEYEHTEDLGLFPGRAGLALLCFLLSDKEKTYKQIALTHVHYLSEHIYEIPSLSFSDGLTGIGWALEFLIQNRYIGSSYDNLLAEIDDIIYKGITFHGISSFSLDDGYTGCFIYLYYRLKGNRIKVPYKELALTECTILAAGRIYKETLKQEKAAFTPQEWLLIHIFGRKFRALNIQDKIMTDLLKQTRNRLTGNLHKVPDPNNDQTISYALYKTFKENSSHLILNRLFYPEYSIKK